MNLIGGRTLSKSILLVEDEKSIARFVQLELKHEGYDVTVCYDGRNGLDAALKQTFDLILLDVMLPELNGIEVCRRVRAQSSVPILLITARDAVMDRVAGLDAGADDYIVKPFAIEELLARIRASLRRSTVETIATPTLSIRNVILDEAGYTATVDGQPLNLTKTEFDLLQLLMRAKNKVCTREIILDTVWGYDTDVETNVVDVYIRHLRAKLPPNMIETVRGVGYVIRE